MAKFVKNDNESPEVDLKNLTVKLAGMGLDKEIEESIPGKKSSKKAKKAAEEIEENADEALEEAEETVEKAADNVAEETEDVVEKAASDVEEELDETSKEIEEFYKKREEDRDLTLEKVEAIANEMSSEHSPEEKKEKKATEAKILKEKKKAHFDGVAVGAIVLAVLALVGGCVYLFFSMRQEPSLKMTEKDFRVNYFKTAIYKNPLIDFGFSIAPPTYRAETTASSSAGTGETTSNIAAPDDKYRYFDEIIDNSLMIPIFMTGRECKDTKYIKDLRFCTGIDEEEATRDVIFIAYSAFLQTMYPDRTSQECVDMVKNAFAQSQASTLPAVIIVDGDYAYSVSKNDINGLTCYVLDIISAKEAKNYEFKFTV